MQLNSHTGGLLCLAAMLCLLATACEEHAPSKGLSASKNALDEQTSPLFAQANDALIDGQVDQALVLCERGLTQGDMACHRLIGIAHKQKKNAARACAAFYQALAHDDPHAITIERYIKHLRCEHLAKEADGPVD